MEDKAPDMAVRNRKHTVVFFATVFVLVLLDQMLKFWVKTSMSLGETIPLLGNWFNLHFVENEGMAFGISFGAQVGKLVLSVLRIVLVGALIWYFFRRLRNGKMDGVVLAVFCLVVAGALGNIIDSMFYGICFTESNFFQVAKWAPGEGYAPFFFGKVVDMFYLKLFRIPDGFPFWGGSYFFPAIFNIADTCITTGIFMALVFNKRLFGEAEEKSEAAIQEESNNNQNQ